MWEQIKRIPLRELENTEEFVYIDKVLSLASNYHFSADDTYLSHSENGALVGNLLQVVASKCKARIAKQDETIRRIKEEKKVIEDSLGRKNEILRAEVLRLSGMKTDTKDLSPSPQLNLSPEVTNSGADTTQLDRLRRECDELAFQLLKATRENSDLNEKNKTHSKEKSELSANLEKFELEYKHLVGRYTTLSETYRKENEALRARCERDAASRKSIEEELERLRQEVGSLREVNEELIASRDHAEEQLESRALRMAADVNEVKRQFMVMKETYTKKIQVLNDEAEAARNANLSEMGELEEQIEERDREIEMLKGQLEAAAAAEPFKKPQVFKGDSNSASGDDVAATASDLTYEFHPANEKQEKLLAAQRRLERENDDLMAEIEQLENRCDAFERENLRLTNLIQNYEKDNKGFSYIKRQLNEKTQEAERLSVERSQLRERLSSVEDSVAFTAALQELCRRMGVTDEEIASLRPKKASVYSELDTLREEIAVLKDEVDWLEKERRHWMNKVRLQPLMDTKLRFELGLSSEQLKQLDHLVDEMKAGRIVVDDDNTTYKEKYFKELEARKRDAATFNEELKESIENTLKQVVASLNTPEAQQIAGTLQEQLLYVNQNHSVAPNAPTVSAKTEEQLNSLRAKVTELEFSAKNDTETISQLRADNIKLTATNELLSKERDQYRDAIFESAGVVSVGKSEDGGSTAKATQEMRWASLSTAFQEQMALKDTVITGLNGQLKSLQDELRESRKKAESQGQQLLVERRNVESLQDQVSALNETREELLLRVDEQQKVNDDLLAARQERNDHELLQKIVLLRKREATLLDRLRRTTALLHEAKISEKAKTVSTERLLEDVKNILQGSAEGFIVPSSSYQREAEEQMLLYFHQRCGDIIKGRLFKEDWEYVGRLQQVYKTIAESEELQSLRLQVSELSKTKTNLQARLDEKLAEEGSAAAADGGAPPVETSSSRASRPSWESEALVWRQKYDLCLKRYKDKEEEVRLLENNLDSVQQELAGFREQLRQLATTQEQQPPPPQQQQEQQTTDGSEDGSAAATATASPRRVTTSRVLEKELARMKSANLSLVQHSLELQGQVKSLEIDLDARSKELSLIKNSGDGRVVSDFVTAAIKEHASLRRQCELASLHAKRLRVQLAATEANFHVVANEATSYKLGSYRLFRQFVDEIVSIVGVVRSLQRTDKGAPSAHRMEIMDKNFRSVLRDLDALSERNKLLALQNSHLQSTNATLALKLDMVGVPPADIPEWTTRQLTELSAKLRDSLHHAVEVEEDRLYQDSKVRRLEGVIKTLNEEVSRLEETALFSESLLSPEKLASLVHLKDTVFSKAAAPPVAVEGVPSSSSLFAEGGAAEGGDVMREYKNAITRTVELSRERDRLRKTLEETEAELRRQRSTVSSLNEEVSRMGDHLKHTLSQLDQERKKAEEREARLIKAHEAQAAVARRADEHNQTCLKSLLRKKEEALDNLQQQLFAERQRYTTQQFDEATRLERLHEAMFRENTAMVERFRAAIDDVGNSFAEREGAGATGSSGTAGSNAGAAQLEALTAELLRLRNELKNLKATNIVLESQLTQQIQDAERALPVVFYPQEVTTGGPRTPPRPQSPATAPPATASLPAPAATAATASTANASTDALIGIINSQSAVMESSRLREAALTERLQKERERNASLEARIEELRLSHVEQSGALNLVSKVTSASDPADVQELRAQLAATEEELAGARRQLELERGNTRRLEADASEWRAQFEALRADIRAQQERGDRAKLLESMNEGLQADLNRLKEQNDKLVLAATVLRQKLTDEAQRGGEAERKGQQDAALTQRMLTIQKEAEENVRSLEKRIKSIQKELNTHAASDKQMLTKAEDSQRLAFQLHQQIREKDREIHSLKQQLRDSVPPGVGRNPAPDPLSMPQVGTAARQEATKMQRDNLQQISTLRSAQARLERELRDARECLKAEQSVSHQLRIQLSQLRSSSSPAAGAPRAGDDDGDAEVRRLRRRLQELEAASAPRTVVPLGEHADGEAPRLQARLAQCASTLERVVADWAREKGTTAESILRQYSFTGAALTAASEARMEELEKELLKKSNIIIDLNFTIENLKLKLRKLEDAERMRKSENTVAESLAENLRLAVARLEKENAELHAALSGSSRVPALLQQISQLREQSAELQKQVAWLSSASLPVAAPHGVRHTGLADPRAPARPSHDSASLTYHPTDTPSAVAAATTGQGQQAVAVDMDGVPLPLPTPHRYRAAALTQGGGDGGPPQRRLSSREGHQFLKHHDFSLS